MLSHVTIRRKVHDFYLIVLLEVLIFLPVTLLGIHLSSIILMRGRDLFITQLKVLFYFIIPHGVRVFSPTILQKARLYFRSSPLKVIVSSLTTPQNGHF